MPRAIWSGSILFGLVNIPVKMYSAVEEKDLHFHLLHTKDDSRIGYEKVCKKEDKHVPDDEIGTAYEVSDGKYVYLTDEDFEAAEPAAYHTIDLSDFVDLEEIDPIYFERTYFLGPAERSEKVYAVLVKAMAGSGLAAIGTYVMRNKQHLGCLRVRDGVLTLSKLYFADEIRSHDELVPKGVRVSKAELELAGQLIDRFTGRFEIEKYRDSYREALLAVIEAKRKGRQIEVEVPIEESEPSDLLSALRESVAHHSRRSNGKSNGKSRPGGSGGRGKGGRDGKLEDLTKAELEERARRSKIKGYSKMKKDELVAALG